MLTFGKMRASILFGREVTETHIFAAFEVIPAFRRISSRRGERGIFLSHREVFRETYHFRVIMVTLPPAYFKYTSNERLAHDGIN